ncbi:MAG: helix-turn-helix domain-containing protein [Anaerolineae bacterium]
MDESIGKRIKAMRQKRKLTLAKLAEKSNLSASHLSQVERDKSTPSLMTLANIAEALEVNLRDLFESERDRVDIRRANHGADEAHDRHSAVRSRLTSRESYWNVEVDRLTLCPEAPDLEFEPYPGEALGFVLKGTLMIVIDDEQFELGLGDSIHYDANRPSCLRCGGERACTVIWCNSPPRSERSVVAKGGDNSDKPL